MILTLTMNPSLDHSYLAETFVPGAMNRFPPPFVSIGGKGVNAGKVAALAGSDVLLTGFLGGEVGQVIERSLRREKRLTLEFLRHGENSRNAITIMHDRGAHTEIVEKGPFIDSDAEERIQSHLERLFGRYPDITALCICGSVNSANPCFYAHLLDRIAAYAPNQLPILMDVSGTQLLNVLRSDGHKPTFIKPNTHELEEIFHTPFTTKEAIREGLRDPLFTGIDVVMVSRGSDGALVKTANGILDVRIPEVEAVNTTGCGDAAVGGAAHAIDCGKTLTDTIAYAMACGVSNATFPTNGTIDAGDVQRYRERIAITEFKTPAPPVTPL